MYLCWVLHGFSPILSPALLAEQVTAIHTYEMNTYLTQVNGAVWVCTGPWEPWPVQEWGREKLGSALITLPHGKWDRNSLASVEMPGAGNTLLFTKLVNCNWLKSKLVWKSVAEAVRGIGCINATSIISVNNKDSSSKSTFSAIAMAPWPTLPESYIMFTSHASSHLTLMGFVWTGRKRREHGLNYIPEIFVIQQNRIVLGVDGSGF